MPLTKVSYSMIAGAYVNVLDFGASGDGITDDTAAIQAAFDHAKDNDNSTVFLPAGEYVVSSPLIVEADTAGFKGTVNIIGVGADASIIKSSVDTGAVIDYTQSANLRFHRQVQIQNMCIRQYVAGTDAHGIRMTGAIQVTISGCLFEDLDGDGVHLANVVGDPDFIVEVRILGNEFRTCGGFGIGGSSTITGYAGHSFRGNRITDCNGGMLIGAYGGEVVLNTIANTLAGTTNPDIEIIYTGLTANRWIVSQNWFEKGRVGAFLIEGAVNCLFDRNYITYNDANSGSYGFKLSGVASKRDCVFSNNTFVIDPAITFVAFEDDANTSACKLVNNLFQNFAGVGHTRYDLDQGTGWSIEEFGLQRLSEKQNIVFSTNTGGTYTPNLLAGTVHRPVFTTTASIAIGNPTAFATAGTTIDLLIGNQTGSAVTPTYGTSWFAQSIPSIPNGSFATARFIYDGNSNVFRQIGAWSI